MPIRARRFLMETDNESVHGWRTPCVVETSLVPNTLQGVEEKGHCTMSYSRSSDETCKTGFLPRGVGEGSPGVELFDPVENN